ncbi:MAG: chemotaxis protein CheW [Pseudomonadota bacterium]
MTQLAASSGADSELLAFQIQNLDFCVEVITVKEIRGWTLATPLPHAPKYVRGVVNLRGAVLPIIDLAARLGFEPREPTIRSVIIVTEIGQQITGLLVDAVSDILTVSSDMIQPTPDLGSDEIRSIVSGIVTIDSRMISILSLEHAFPSMQLEAAA